MNIKIMFLAWILLRISLFAYSQPPIEVIYFRPSDVADTKVWTIL